MSNKAVFGLARDESHAERIVQALQAAGFSYNEISVLFADRNGLTSHPVGTDTSKRAVTNDPFGTNVREDVRRSEYSTPREEIVDEDVDVVTTRDTPRTQGGTLGHEKHTKAPEGATTGAVSGGIIGGSLGLLAGIGSLAIPGAGPFIAAGAIMSTLAGSALGGATGMLLGALIGLGIPEIEAKQYEGRVKEGSVLVSVHTDSSEEVTRATEVLKAQGAKDICNTLESTSRVKR